MLDVWLLTGKAHLKDIEHIVDADSDLLEDGGYGQGMTFSFFFLISFSFKADAKGPGSKVHLQRTNLLLNMICRNSSKSTCNTGWHK